MIEIELIELLNKYSKTNDIYQTKKIKESIINLISENKERFNKFIETQSINLDDKSKNLINQCLEEIKEKLSQKNQETEIYTTNNSNNKLEHNNVSNPQIIFNEFKRYQEEVIKNDYQINQTTQNIIDKIINQYTENNFEIIKRILQINESNIYENFKNNLKNSLRTYFIKKIKNYRESDKYKNLNFFQKLKKKKQIYKIYLQIGKYKFNKEEIDKLINN